MFYEVNDCEVFFLTNKERGINPGTGQLNEHAAV